MFDDESNKHANTTKKYYLCYKVFYDLLIVSCPIHSKLLFRSRKPTGPRYNPQ